jgi:hypothetical protein
MPVPSDVQSRQFVMILIQVSSVCEIFDIKSPMARNLTILFKSFKLKIQVSEVDKQA